MPTSRKILVASAVALACHFVALAFHSALASSVIEFALLLLATAACFEAAARTAGYARRFWRLMGVRLLTRYRKSVLATLQLSGMQHNVNLSIPGKHPRAISRQNRRA